LGEESDRLMTYDMTSFNSGGVDYDIISEDEDLI